MARYACFRGDGAREAWWEVITPPEAVMIWDRDLGVTRSWHVSQCRYYDPDCEHHDELPDHVVAAIAAQALLP
jgi:hypothetical protein